MLRKLCLEFGGSAEVSRTRNYHQQTPLSSLKFIANRQINSKLWEMLHQGTKLYRPWKVQKQVTSLVLRSIFLANYASVLINVVAADANRESWRHVLMNWKPVSDRILTADDRCYVWKNVALTTTRMGMQCAGIILVTVTIIVKGS